MVSKLLVIGCGEPPACHTFATMRELEDAMGWPHGHMPPPREARRPAKATRARTVRDLEGSWLWA
jgi:hypothetical protein